MKKNASVIQHRPNFSVNNSRSSEKIKSITSHSHVISKNSNNDSKRNYSTIGKSTIKVKKDNSIKTNFNAVEINPKILTTNKSSSALYTKKSSSNLNEVERKDIQNEVKNISNDETGIYPEIKQEVRRIW
jgi:hypothetical protein